VFFIAHYKRGGKMNIERSVVKTGNGILEHSAVPDQRQELLRKMFPREWPEAGS
jgi:hypothetical protein